MTNNGNKTRDCPYCKEAILSGAIKCKHCGSSVAAEAPAHKGVCPYCKEKINPEAVKCKHCKSMLGQAYPLEQGVLGTGCGCDGVRKQPQLSTGNDLGEMDIGGASIPNLPLAQKQLSFGGFDIKCYYLGPFLGRWCCLYFNGRWINCSEMRFNQFSQ